MVDDRHGVYLAYIANRPAEAVMQPSVAYDKGQMAILNALEIDDSLAEAHATLGWVRMAHAWDWSGAEQSFQRAIALNPGYASAQQWYGVYLAYIANRPAEALEKFLVAEQLDPLSPIIRSNTVQALMMLGRFDEATNPCRPTFLFPDFDGISNLVYHIRSLYVH